MLLNVYVIVLESLVHMVAAAPATAAAPAAAAADVIAPGRGTFRILYMPSIFVIMILSDRKKNNFRKVKNGL